jgi:hypothetical protein
MLYLSSTRRKGARKISFIRKEIAARRKVNKTTSSKPHTLFLGYSNASIVYSRRRKVK